MIRHDNARLKVILDAVFIIAHAVPCLRFMIIFFEEHFRRIEKHYNALKFLKLLTWDFSIKYCVYLAKKASLFNRF